MRRFDGFARCGRGFLHKNMQHQQTAVLKGNVHRTGDAVTACHAHFPELVLQWANMRQTDLLWPERFQQFGNMQESGLQVVGQCFQFRLGQGVNGYRLGTRNHTIFAIFHGTLKL